MHLKNKVENQRPENYFETRASQDTIVEPERGLPIAPDCELDQPRWSVVSFDKTEYRGLIYSQAVSLLIELDSRDISGLCIVTDEAASRLSR